MRDTLLNATKKCTFPIKTKSPLMKLLNMELQDFYIVVNFKADNGVRAIWNLV